MLYNEPLKKNIDLLNPKNQAETDSVLLNYISKRLAILVNAKKTTIELYRI